MENNVHKYIKKPIAISAYVAQNDMDIDTLEGVMHANRGDYIVTGVNGEQYPVRRDIFKKTYDRVDAPHIPNQKLLAELVDRAVDLDGDCLNKCILYDEKTCKCRANLLIGDEGYFICEYREQNGYEPNGVEQIEKELFIPVDNDEDKK